MSKVSITRSKLDNLAVAVSAKSGATLPLTIAQMQSAVESISQPSAGTIIPLPDSGNGSVGISTSYAREDHVHPSDTTKANVADLGNVSGLTYVVVTS